MNREHHKTPGNTLQQCLVWPMHGWNSDLGYRVFNSAAQDSLLCARVQEDDYRGRRWVAVKHQFPTVGNQSYQITRLNVRSPTYGITQ